MDEKIGKEGTSKRSKGGGGGPKEFAEIEGVETEIGSKEFKINKPGESMTMV